MATSREQYIASQFSPETRRAYARDLRVLDDWLAAKRLNHILDTSDAIAFRDYLVDKYAPAGAARVWATVKGYYRFCGFQAEVFDQVKSPRRVKDKTPVVPDDFDVDRLVAFSWSDPVKRLVVSLLLNGLRASEVCDLAKSNMETFDGNVVLRVLGKGQRERFVPMTVEAQQAYIMYAQTANEAQRGSTRVVVDASGSPLTYRKVEHIVYDLAKAAGIEGMHPHALRHHYATRLIKAGATPFHVQRLLGHSSVMTTQVYVTLDLTDLVKAADLDPRNAETKPQEFRAAM